MTNFIGIQETRILKSSIKRYAPNGETKLNIYYTAGRAKVDCETFTYATKEERDDIIDHLDSVL